jgi:DNA-binding NtrC family response regulator
VSAFPHDKHSASAPRVLLVEDDDTLREELVEALSLRGVDVLSVTGPTVGLDTLRRDRRITVLLTDVRMPDGDGITLAEQVLRECDGPGAVEVIVLTGHATLDTVADADRLRISALLRKPIRLAALLAAIHTAHGGAEQRRQRSARVMA